ncbi:3-phenylpropionate MFS transporter [Thaumasiovibrio sp. DFM-14]|uniref:3-phenylpropionate MFS transporter n=1 Tax=Thaumasiovibrio sp. DFM-14 TaxID=3384792 RepID=UPI0039A258C2
MLRPSPYAYTSQYLFGFFFSYGIYLPFWAVWFAFMGMEAKEIGLLTGLGLITRAGCNLLLTPRIYRPEQLLPAIRWITAASAVVVGLHLFVGGEFWLLALITILFNICYAPLIPLGDSLTNYYQVKQQLDYGRTRLWGSIAFVVGNWVVGSMTEQYGESVIPWLALAGLIAAMLLSCRTPTLQPISSVTRAKRPSLRQLFRRGTVVRFLLITSLLQGSHAAYYAFSAISWRELGVSDSLIGVLWSIGVMVEIGVFQFGGRFFLTWPIHRMMRLAAMGVVIRWGLLGTVTSVWWLSIAQSLHGITFAVAHLAAIRYIQQQHESERVAWQSLYNAIPLGLMMGGLSILCGPLYAVLHQHVFLVMALFAIPVFFIRIQSHGPLCAQRSAEKD